MKAVIIDDEPLARSVVKEYLQSHPEIEVMQECSDGFEGMKAIQQYQPDIIFLDIQMPKINGFEMLDLIDNLPHVIFTTAFEEYAIKAFEAHAADYLLKPFSQERFDKSIEKLFQQQNSITTKTQQILGTASQSPMQANRIVVKDGSKIKIIPVSQVQYLEAADDYVKIHSKDGIFLKKKTMQYFEESLLLQQFIRIHRSYIINTQLITRIESNEKDGHSVLLNTGVILPVSKAGYIRLRETLGI